MNQPLNTPMDMAVAAVNAASANVRDAIDKLPDETTYAQQAEAARLQIELANAAAQIEIARQLSALSAIAAPGASIRYGMAQVAEAIVKAGGR